MALLILLFDFFAQVHFSSCDLIKTEQPIRYFSLTNYVAVELVPDLSKPHYDFTNLTQPYNHLKPRLTGHLNIKMSLKDNREVMCWHLVLSKRRLFDNTVAAGFDRVASLVSYLCRKLCLWRWVTPAAISQPILCSSSESAFLNFQSCWAR